MNISIKMITSSIQVVGDFITFCRKKYQKIRWGVKLKWMKTSEHYILSYLLNIVLNTNLVMLYSGKLVGKCVMAQCDKLIFGESLLIMSNSM